MDNAILRPKPAPTEAEAYQRLSALCAASEQCRHDTDRKMRLWGMDDDVRERVTQRLVAERFIDEERYARAFALDKFRYNRWGCVRIERELRMRHIAAAHIAAALECIDERDTLSTLCALLDKKRPSVKGKSDYEIKAKLFRFAIGRGFTPDEIENALRYSLETDR